MKLRPSEEAAKAVCEGISGMSGQSIAEIIAEHTGCDKGWVEPVEVKKPKHDTPWVLSGPNHDVCIVGASGEAVYRTRMAVRRNWLEGERMAHIIACVNADAKGGGG